MNFSRCGPELVALLLCACVSFCGLIVVCMCAARNVVYVPLDNRGTGYLWLTSPAHIVSAWSPVPYIQPTATGYRQCLAIIFEILVELINDLVIETVSQLAR